LNQRLPRISGAQRDIARTDPNATLFIERMRDFYEEQANMATDARAGITLTAFRGIAQAVAGLPGRKSLVWVSGAFPLATYQRIIQYSADATNDPNRKRFDHVYEDLLRETDSILNDAQIAVYPVDARGLVGQLLGGAEKQGVSAGGTLLSGAEYAQTLQLASDAIIESQSTMKQAAADTGGKVYINQNELDHAVALSVADGSAYYLIGYSPDAKPDGKFHKIEVKLNRGDATVRARRGYFASTSTDEAKTTKQRDAEVFMAMQYGSPGATGVTFDARIVSPAPAAKMKVGVDFIVDPGTISAEDVGGEKKLAVEFHAVAYGADRKPAAQKDVAIKPSLKPAAYASIQQQGLPYHLDLELPPGKYQIRLGVVDQRSGYVGTADMPLVLPGK
jgi:VWFA-related protein